jgi:hypothetical protein
MAVPKHRPQRLVINSTCTGGRQYRETLECGHSVIVYASHRSPTHACGECWLESFNRPATPTADAEGREA